MARKTAERQTKRLPRVTVPEATAGPLAGALVGYGVFAILVVVIGALFAGDDFRLPSEDWKSLGFGASVLAGIGLALLGGRAISAGTTGDQRENLETVLPSRSGGSST